MLSSALEIITPTWLDFPGVFVFLLSSLLLAIAYRPRGNKTGLPLLNGKKPWELSSYKARMRYVKNGPDILRAGFAKSPRGFYALTEVGTDLILSHKYTEEVAKDKRFDVFGYTEEKMHGHLPGFALFTTKYMPANKTLNSFVLQELTSAIDKSAGILSSEAHNHLLRLWTDHTEWVEISLKDTILTLLSCMSSRILVGKDLSHDQSWTELVERNSVNAFQAGDALHNWPRIFRPLVHWFLAPCRSLRRDLKEARQRVNEVIQQRRESRGVREAQGKSFEYFDSIQWMEEAADGHDYDPTLVQLTLSMVSEHTMTDLLTQTMLNLTKHPGLVQDLRKEIIAVMKNERWGRQSLRKLMLMDSVFKETQRLKPFSRGIVKRKARTSVQLSDGLEIPKDTTFFITSEHMQSNSTYPDADKFDGYRFYKLRQQPGHENLHRLVNTSTSEVGFGHGRYACPGRFFADAAGKILLCHILLKYDFHLAEGSTIDYTSYGTSLVSNPTAKLVVRRREAEIIL